MSECELDKLLALVQTNDDQEQDEGQVEDQADEQEEAEDQDEDQDEQDLSGNQSLDEALADVGGLAGLKALVAQVKANEDQERNKLIDRLAANDKLQLTRGQLEAMATEALHSLVRTFQPADYSGQGGQDLQPNKAEMEPYPVPQIDFGGK